MLTQSSDDVTGAARKHGVEDSDIEHAVRNAIRVLNPVAIHAMVLRHTLYDRLRPIT
ncbi:MAG: hypothetical protein M3137_04345 [Actinomycetota bacterium]|nr:hypothetical protein [Actinomycetota bacterium]